MSIVIHDCPFCDHADVEIEEVTIGEFAVDCPECRCIGPIAGDIMGAIAAWNGSCSRNIKGFETIDKFQPAKE